MINKAMTWDEAMSVWKNLPPIQEKIVHQAAIRYMIDSGFQEIGSSDINHVVYGLINSGTYKDAIREFGLEVA